MDLVTIIVVVLACGVLVYAVYRWAPLTLGWKQFFSAVVAFCLVIWLLSGVFGVSLPNLRIGG